MRNAGLDEAQARIKIARKNINNPRYADDITLMAESEVVQSYPTLCDPMDSSLHQAPPSMRFSRQEYWSGLPRPPPGKKARKFQKNISALLTMPKPLTMWITINCGKF